MKEGYSLRLEGHSAISLKFPAILLQRRLHGWATWGRVVFSVMWWAEGSYLFTLLFIHILFIYLFDLHICCYLHLFIVLLLFIYLLYCYIICCYLLFIYYCTHC